MIEPSDATYSRPESAAAGTPPSATHNVTTRQRLKMNNQDARFTRQHPWMRSSLSVGIALLLGVTACVSAEDLGDDEFSDDAADFEEPEDAEEFRVFHDTCGDDDPGGGQPPIPPPVCTGSTWCTGYSSSSDCEDWCEEEACWWSQAAGQYQCDYLWLDDCLDSCDACNCPS